MMKSLLQGICRSASHQLASPLESAVGWRALSVSTQSFGSAPADQVQSTNDRPKWGESLIGNVMKAKADSGAPSAALFSCAPTDTVLDAVKKMASANVGSIVILEDPKNTTSVAGLITERDYMRKVVILGKQSKDMACSSIMTPRHILLTLTSNDSVLKAMSLMENHNIRHIPIIDDGNLRGMLSIKDVVSTMVMEHNAEVESMAEYIIGSY